MIELILVIILVCILLQKIYNVWIKYRESFKQKHIFYAKIADNNVTRKKGLMYRKKKLKHNQGMLFDFEEPQTISLWMKNTFIPLDAVYFNDDGKIIDLKYSLIPKSTKSVISKQLCRFVLEVNEKTILNKNIKIGDYIKINKIKSLK